MSTRVLNLPNGIVVNVAQPYAEGHVLSALEAEKLNHVLADNIRTSLMSKLKRLEDVDAEKVGAEFQSYADSYSFVVRSPKATVDPVTKEAMKIAKEQVLAAIRSKGGDPKDYSAERISEYVSIVLQKKPEIREEAARRVSSSREMASDLLPDFFGEAA
jgi:hypothetical protein